MPQDVAAADGAEGLNLPPQLRARRGARPWHRQHQHVARDGERPVDLALLVACEVGGGRAVHARAAHHAQHALQLAVGVLGEYVAVPG